MTPLILWGGTGQARVLREAVGATACVLAVFDNRDIAPPFPDVRIYRGESGLDAWAAAYNGPRPVAACVAIGGGHGADRIAVQHMLQARGYAPLTVVHPRAFVATDAALGAGCQILAMAAVCAGARLGEAVIVNTGASVDHDTVLDAGVHIGPGARLAGDVHVGACAFVGTGAVVLPRLRIGAHATVGAGAVVTRDVPDGAIVVGNPARPVPSSTSRDDA